jgi:hypothetical protein
VLYIGCTVLSDSDQIGEVKMGWTFSSGRKGKKFVKNFGGEAFYRMVTWKPKKKGE